jgi:hypothetical protein
MSAKRIALAWVIAVLAVAGSMAADFDDAFSKGPSWQPAKAEDVHKQALAWLDARKADAAIKQKAEEIWSGKTDGMLGIEVLERLVRTFALADDNARKLAEVCSRPKEGYSPPAQPWLADPSTPPFEAQNLRLWYGRWLVHEKLFDEALEQIAALKPSDVVDPASLLFYKSVVHHRLLDQDAGLDSIALLKEAEQGPRRYATLARLMEADLKSLKEDSLDHIARRMEDIERRLDLGRAGPKVRKIQDDVVKSLDKLIEELEKQQQQGGGGGSGGKQSSNPAQDSTPMGGKGPGEVVRKNVGNQSGWGNLPPKEREAALQQIGRDFPSHYRDLIEQYFRKLASEGSEK